MNLFQKSTGHAPHVLLGLLLLSVASSLLLTESSILQTRYTDQEIVQAAHLLRADSHANGELQRSLAARCTPGFVCGSRRSMSKPRVSGKTALRFALGMGLGISR